MLCTLRVFLQMDYHQYNEGQSHHTLPALECYSDRKLAERLKMVPFFVADFSHICHLSPVQNLLGTNGNRQKQTCG